MFAERLGDCPRSPSDTQDLVANAKGRAGNYALGAGFRRCSFRASAPNSRAPCSVGDVPEFMAAPKWYLFEAFCSTRMRKSCRAQSYRLAESPPRFESLRGSLYDEGSVYQSASRVFALVFVLVCV